MRRLVLSVLTATALLSGFTPAWAEDSAPTPAAPAAPTSAEPTSATPTPDPLLPVVPITTEARDEAKDALTTVSEIFKPKTRAAAQRQTQTGADPTLALRDLSLRINALGRAQRGTALAQFQRPWDDGAVGTRTDCTDPTHPSATNICLHWATSASATGSAADVANSTWAENTVLPVLGNVSATYQQAGYRKPKADGPRTDGANMYGRDAIEDPSGTKTDIYLADLGGQGVYGYCAYDLNDSGQLVYATAHGDVPSFCVLDNDFSLSTNGGQYRPTYSGETSADILKVTAAHEYFHAVQFAYDAFEDAWFMEATATWAEHQLYPAIPDNRQFLPYSQLRFPQVSLDTWNGVGGFMQYGDWIFFEYLTERIPNRVGPLPGLVLKMWQYADSLRGSNDQYSMQAISSALAVYHSKLQSIYAQYAAANRRPSRTYHGGSTYPVAAPRRTVAVRSHKRRSGSFRIDHLASMTVRLRPQAIRRAGHKATIRVNMAARRLGSVAVATVFLKNGQQAVRTFKLNKKGDGHVRVAFSSRRVAYVDVTLVNTNHSYHGCSADRQGYACGGQPLHDQVKESWSISS
ncbi:MXAN_6640 family putative metalloprotease [Nocardioides sp. Kera G14]|uniref:MXAN_6640 family putative metalloprotease n=1 Tax=Nocardioides sp. Kera G14 TaxID=2884264 RepID=UPI001D101834|nr:MXAN_6640 family putative metalloprotease [Nocardioides sp. Kera G14]UDY24146.1 hypothetical protein LH076_02290 [Nocardioides sp. Kera G14]